MLATNLREFRPCEGPLLTHVRSDEEAVRRGHDFQIGAAAFAARRPLFDTARTVGQLEAAYARMWERFRQGEAPAAFAVDPA